MREFETHRLPSGLTVHLLEYDGPSTVAILRIGIGKLDDPKGKEGAAHVIEHMLAGENEPSEGFLGRYWLDEERIYKWESASTGSTFTDYPLLCETGHEASLLRYLREKIFQPERLTDLDHHLQCVVNERLYRGSNEAALDLLKSLFEHPRLGTATSLPDTATAMTFCLATLRRHHRKWYRFGNANLIMASPRTWTELKPIINAAFRTDEAASNGTPPLRVIATPKEQNRPMRISFGPNQKTVKLKMATGFPNPLPPAVTLLFRTLVRIRLMDGLRASFRTSYSPQVYFEHHGVATIFRVTATAARDMAPTLRDGLTGPFEDPGWVSDYLEPVRKTLHAGLTLEPEGSIQSRLSSFTKLLHMHGKPIRRQETIDHLEKISEEEIVALLTYVNRIGFHKTLS